MTFPQSNSPAAAPEGSRSKGLGLTARVLLLILGFVLVAEAIIYVSALSNARLSLLKDRISAANTAALVFAASPQDMIPKSLAMEILDSVGTKTIAMKIHGTKRLLAVSDMPEAIDEEVDLRDASAFVAIPAAFRTLFASKNRVLNVRGPAPMGGDFIDIVMDESPIQQSLRATSTNILLASALLSALVAGLAALALDLMVLKPIRRLTRNLMDFAQNPADFRRIIVPSGASHEIGQAEGALASMETALSTELKEKKHLAALGLAVAKINHDLRNMLASAQLFSDRLALVKDPTARRIGEKLISTLDRAIAFCHSTLAYGRSLEPQPKPKWLDFHAAAAEVADALGLNFGENHILWRVDAPSDLKIYADPEHFQRILLNLARNSLQALKESPQIAAPSISLHATQDSAAVRLLIGDNGPGIPEHLRARLFQAFHITARAGGSGLGLAIAAELVHSHGGEIQFMPRDHGAWFTLSFPNPASDLH